MFSLKKLNKKLYDWMRAHGQTPRAQVTLSAVAFFESSFFPIPPSTFLAAMIALGDRKRWLYLALLTTLMSVLGGLFGYLIGSVLYDTLGRFIISTYNLEDTLVTLGAAFDRTVFLTMFVAAFTPIPYKAFTIAGGFFGVDLFLFTLASVAGRGLRFLIVGALAYVYGEYIAERITNYFALLTLAAVGIVIVFALATSF